MRECQFAIFIAALFGLSACEALQGLPEKNRRSADDDFSRSTPTPDIIATRAILVAIREIPEIKTPPAPPNPRPLRRES